MRPSQEEDHLLEESLFASGEAESQKSRQKPQASNRYFSLSLSTAAQLIILLLSVALVYHVLILTQVVPYQNVWGGRLGNLQEMYSFETIAVLINLTILAVTLARLLDEADSKLLRILCWICCLLYALNTVGNIFAQTYFERLVFMPVTLLLSISFARLAMGEDVST